MFPFALLVLSLAYLFNLAKTCWAPVFFLSLLSSRSATVPLLFLVHFAYCCPVRFFFSLVEFSSWSASGSKFAFYPSPFPSFLLGENKTPNSPLLLLTLFPPSSPFSVLSSTRLPLTVPRKKRGRGVVYLTKGVLAKTPRNW